MQAIGLGFEPRAQFACHPAASRGRLFSEPASPTRSGFQRDRDRIIHSTAFRRLKHKTQVFVSHEGDHYRTRLTHTIEVSQIARAIARAFRADEDLAEAVALVHDFGHTPFGHAGEETLDALMADHGGFDHNAQSLRIVTKLERRYAEFDGLNLTWETLDGLVKHNGPYLDAQERPLRTVPLYFSEFSPLFDLDLRQWCALEGQAAAIADDIAYNTHDIDDGSRADLFRLEELAEAVPFVAEILDGVRRKYPHLERSRLVHEFQRRQITEMVEDVIAETERRIDALQPQDADAIRRAGHATVAFSEEMQETDRALKRFLFERMYRHPSVNLLRTEAENVVADLFHRFIAEPHLMSADWSEAAAQANSGERAARIVADYIAGMTDSYALRQHQRLFDRVPAIG